MGGDGVDAWKRVQVAAGGALFYLPEDPAEQTNLANRYPEKAKELHRLLKVELNGVAMSDAANSAGGAIKH